MAGESIDNHKLMYHPQRVAEWIEKGDNYPVYVEIGPTNSCNHKCVFCALDYLKNGKKFINTDIMISTLEEMAEKGVKSIMFAGEGEPTLHKSIGLFTKKAKEYGLDISITTNGVPFTKNKIEQCLPNLSWIRFSIDSGSPENYAKVHGTNTKDFFKVINNVQETVKLRDKNKLETTIGVQFLIIPQNINEATNLAKILKEIGVDNLQVKPYSHHPNSLNNLIVDPKQYNQLENHLMEFNSDNFEIKFRKSTIKRIEEGISYPKCYGLPFFTLIDSKGDILPCNLFYDKKEFIYGNLYEQSFSEIWKGKKRQEVLKKINTKGTENCRKGCRIDPDNRYLHRLKNPLPHDNFI
ncbi:MAG: radical SAM protein [Nanoarchaeota archaeon]|nr:radical SAM protein [Nanoarchaeota archaeon]